MIVHRRKSKNEKKFEISFKRISLSSCPSRLRLYCLRQTKCAIVHDLVPLQWHSPQNSFAQGLYHTTWSELFLCYRKKYSSLNFKYLCQPDELLICASQLYKSTCCTIKIFVRRYCSRYFQYSLPDPHFEGIKFSSVSMFLLYIRDQRKQAIVLVSSCVPGNRVSCDVPKTVVAIFSKTIRCCIYVNNFAHLIFIFQLLFLYRD